MHPSLKTSPDVQVTPSVLRNSASVLVIAALFLAACEKTDTQQTSNETPEPQSEEFTVDYDAASPDDMMGGITVTGQARNGGHTAAMDQKSVGYPMALPPEPVVNTERYEDFDSNTVKIVAEEPVSTFSIDVDTASYGVVRRYLNDGVMPPRDAVRVEELINYFDYDYTLPANGNQPFKPTVHAYETPWNPDTQIVHIGIKGFDLPKAERPDSNLVLLLDVSGSMNSEDKLPLLKKAMRLLINEMGEDDTISIVVYAGAAGTVLEPTKANEQAKIMAALDQLSAGGSTAGGEGIRQAYSLAEASFVKDGVNRVILATDGDFNVGINDPERLEDFVAQKRETGVYLTVLGFGDGNYNDVMMQKLAQAGNGNAAYIDTLNEARKVLVEEVGGTLFPIANDVKIQVEFNPQQIAEYRLIGYETRILDRADFNNDKVDAGDIGSGHSVTALYEVTPVGSDGRLTDPLRYNPEESTGAIDGSAEVSGEYAFLRIRYKLPGEDQSKLIERAITADDTLESLSKAPVDVRFASAVAAFGQLLRGGDDTKDYDFKSVIDLAQSAKGDDPFGYRAEFIQLARLAQSAAGLPTLNTSPPTIGQ
jgi:Ca-activated chloride channel family protein